MSGHREESHCGLRAVTRRELLKLGAVVAIDSVLLGRLLETARVFALPVESDVFQTSNFDGEGAVEITPNDGLVVQQYYTLHVSFVIGPHGIQTGGGFRFVIPAGLPLVEWWSPPQIDDPKAAGFSTVTWQSAGRATVKLEPIWRGVHIVVSEGALQAGDVITLIYGDTRKGAPGARIQRTAAKNVAFHVASDFNGNGTYRLLKTVPTVTTVAGMPAELLVTVPSHVRSGEPFSLRVAVLDFYKNAVENFTGTIALSEKSSKTKNLELPAQITLTANDRGVGKATVIAPEAGSLQFNARVVTGSVESKPLKNAELKLLAASSNPALVFSKPPEFELLWGDIHGHTARSDGGGIPNDYYRYARDVIGLDFGALTDHDDMLDDQEWKDSQRVTNSFNAPGNFTTFIAYEWTHWGHGHRNVYFKGNNAPIFRRTAPETNNPARLWAALRNTNLEVMTIAHHSRGLPGTFDGGQAEIDWQRYRTTDEMESLVEVYSIHGHSENAQLAGPDYADRHGFVQEALRQGLRLGLIGGGDDHSGHPGMGPGAHGEPAGLTAVYARENTREAIWEALKTRRVYATTGQRIIVEFQADAHWMGEEFTTDTDPRFVARVWGTNNVDRIELLRDARVLHVQNGDSLFLTLNYVDAAPISKTHFYYIRVWQADGAMAWAGPIWVTRPKINRTLAP